ncbi:Phytocyanin domain containing protein [Parasponia andersonii]|uniref:Basic blue protein n=1 Tax=Parasponia andersonii TaxID=3476 RepID=A0A2P5DMH9_PARAD|nr:Phytocyanin domain containing protein [Parasponia andersonii]
MWKGRGSAVPKISTIVVVVALLYMVANLECVQAATYTVGGTGGWRFNVNKWSKGKHFRVGDVLIFKYSPKLHNVVVVDKKNYAKCKTPPRAKVYRSGKNKITLVKGLNNFICNMPGHCESGMKISIIAH